MKHFHNKGIVHRDLKLENIIIDYNLNLQILDFGMGADRKIESLSSYRGTKSYTAPEIRENKVYNGT